MTNKITCHKCKHEHNADDLVADECLPVTYWGGDGDDDDSFYCSSCEHEIRVKENVSRSWEVLG